MRQCFDVSSEAETSAKVLQSSSVHTHTHTLKNTHTHSSFQSDTGVPWCLQMLPWLHHAYLPYIIMWDTMTWFFNETKSCKYILHPSLLHRYWKRHHCLLLICFTLQRNSSKQQSNYVYFLSNIFFSFFRLFCPLFKKKKCCYKYAHFQVNCTYP